MPAGLLNTQVRSNLDSLGRALDSLITRLGPFCAFLIMPGVRAQRAQLGGTDLAECRVSGWATLIYISAKTGAIT